MTQLTELLKQKYSGFDTNNHCILSKTNASTKIIPLVHQGIICVEGADAATFLQGQLTCDVRRINPNTSLLGSHCNIKGHVISLFRLLQLTPDKFWLRLNCQILDSAQAGLGKYIIFSKANITNISHQIAGIGIIGAGTKVLIEQLFGQSPEANNSVLPIPQGVVIAIADNRYEIWVEATQINELVNNLPDEVDIGSTSDWMLSEINAAIPDIYPATQASFLPQMLNLQALEAVSFSKGCYTGQETIARLQHRGILKKHLYIAEVTTDISPEIGDSIDSDNKSNVGQVILSSDCDKEKTYRLLVVAVKKLAENTELYIKQKKLHFLKLPYQLEPELFLRKKLLD